VGWIYTLLAIVLFFPLFTWTSQTQKKWFTNRSLEYLKDYESLVSEKISRQIVFPAIYDDTEAVNAFKQIASPRSTEENFNNRLADFLGYVGTALDALIVLLSLVLGLIACYFFIINETISGLSFFGSSILIQALIWPLGFFLSHTCKLLTNRELFEPQFIRKVLVEMERRNKF
jgi:hypothetical protein